MAHSVIWHLLRGGLYSFPIPETNACFPCSFYIVCRESTLQRLDFLLYPHCSTKRPFSCDAAGTRYNAHLFSCRTCVIPSSESASSSAVRASITSMINSAWFSVSPSNFSVSSTVIPWRDNRYSARFNGDNSVWYPLLSLAELAPASVMASWT